MRFSIEDAQAMARQALVAVGASEALATALANATVAAELSGRQSVGFSHLLDYLDSILSGRIIGSAQPEISFPAPAMIQVDAKGGVAQLGFDLAFNELQKRTDLYGIAVFSQSNSYSAGELGYYTRRLGEAGLVAVAATNGPAHVAAGKSAEAVYGTNPLSFAAPTENGPPLVIDQASSATAFVNVRSAAEHGEQIPEGWAIDTKGRPTTDSNEALKGALLAFGGSRGANIALLVEILAAGVAGANWSLDAPSFTHGDRSPGAGLLIIAIKPTILAPNFSIRLASHLARLATKGIHIPGRKQSSLEIELPDTLVEALGRYNKP